MKSRRDGIKGSRKKTRQWGLYTPSIAIAYTGNMEALCTHAQCWSSKLNEEEREELTNMSQWTKMHVCLAAQKNYICVGIGRMNDQK